jgi:hypothetical protein
VLSSEVDLLIALQSGFATCESAERTYLEFAVVTFLFQLDERVVGGAAALWIFSMITSSERPIEVISITSLLVMRLVSSWLDTEKARSQNRRIVRWGNRFMRPFAKVVDFGVTIRSLGLRPRGLVWMGLR